MLIKAINLEKIYHTDEVETVALRGINLEIEQGEFVAIMGPSGSGKSTLLHILGFLDRPTKGQYFFQGKTMDEFSDEELARIRNKEIGFIFQDFNLLPRTSVLDNVCLPLLYAGMGEKEQKELAIKAIEEVGLKERLTHLPSQLSGGEKQRVAIARAVVNNPAVIFADEPTGNLDSKTGEVVMKIISQLNQKGHTIVLVTHETYTAQYAQRIIRMKDGLVENEELVKNRRFVDKDGFIK